MLAVWHRRFLCRHLLISAVQILICLLADKIKCKLSKPWAIRLTPLVARGEVIANSL
jgi:hypothetical protein